MKRFTKKALPLAIAAAMVPGFASAAEVSGFADVFYNVASDANPTTDGLFTANGEIDVTAAPADGVTVRVDVDLSLASNGGANASSIAGGPSDSGTLEQAYFAWGVTEGVTVLGGVFNNPIGAEAEDAPDINFNTHGVVYNILDHQTTLAGDNV
ncbi:MAG TPA: hypothetical protein ENK35_04070, partial [Candidatus Tenderia sp.]|nr:hypothetical protein [Candidatus Tenderia sp.]